MVVDYKTKKEAIKGYDTELSSCERSDCVVCAFAAVFNITYKKAHKFVKEHYFRRDKRGTRDFNWKTNRMAIEQEVIFGKKIIKHEPLSYKNEKCVTVGQFLKYYKYRKGTFLISVRNHAFVIKNGVVIGNLEDSKSLRTRLDKVWQIV